MGYTISFQLIERAKFSSDARSGFENAETVVMHSVLALTEPVADGRLRLRYSRPCGRCGQGYQTSATTETDSQVDASPKNRRSRR